MPIAKASDAWRNAVARAARARRLRRMMKMPPLEWKPAGLFGVIKVLPPEVRSLVDSWLAEHGRR
jgi:hypothetical protein